MTTAFFVAADWLAEHIDDPEIQILDARMAPPGQEDRDVGEEYRAGHIPGAVFFDIEALSDHTSPLPHMMPRPEAFAVAMRELGVDQDKHLVIYDDGNLPSCVAFSGSWGYYNWNGLDLSSNITSIKKINYGEPVEY